MVDQFVGKWHMTKSENFDDFLKAIGISWIIRKVAINTHPTVTISQDGDKITIKTESALKTTEVTFMLGEEFEESRADGVKVKSVVKLEDGKLVQNAFGEKPYEVIREIEDGKLKTICKINEICSTRIYEKV